MFANTPVSHSQIEIVNVYQAGSLPPPSGPPPNTWISQVTVVITAPISTTNITGLRTWTRGSSFLMLSITARLTMSRRNREIAWRSRGGVGAVGSDAGAGVCSDMSAASTQAVEGEIDFEHVDVGFAGEVESALPGVGGD